MSKKNGRFFEHNRQFVLACRLLGRGHSAAKKITSILNMNKPISKVAWKKHMKAITEAAINVSNTSMNNAALEAEEYTLSTKYIPEGDALLSEDVTEVSVSVGGSWGSRGFSS